MDNKVLLDILFKCLSLGREGATFRDSKYHVTHDPAIHSQCHKAPLSVYTMLREYEELETELGNIEKELCSLPSAHSQRRNLCMIRDITKVQLDCLALNIAGILSISLMLKGEGIYGEYAYISGQKFCGIKGKEITLDEPNEGMLPGEKPKTDTNTVWLH